MRNVIRGLFGMVGVLAAMFTSAAGAVPIGTVQAGDKFIVEFQFTPLASTPAFLAFGLGGIGSGAGSNCEIDLFDGGGLISSATTTHNLVCQGTWSSNATPVSPSIDLNVDLSGLAAGETGRIEFVPLFDPGEFVSFGEPGLFFGGSRLVSLTHTIVPAGVPAPASLGLLAIAVAGLATAKRRRR